jgi:Trm5-related predicted tRNA methylase
MHSPTEAEMKSMTVRGIDPVLAQKLKRAAKEQGKSVNQLIVETIRKAFGMHKEKQGSRTYDDLDGLFGRWSQAHLEAVQGSIDQQRKIDDELWK